MFTLLYVIIKDAMVLIHLAKASLLETSCDYFKGVFIPERIKKEVQTGKFADEKIILDLINKKKLIVKKVEDTDLIVRVNEFDIFDGEAEAVALYWELDADFIATDDANVRKKAEILNLELIGTPTIILRLFEEKKIDKEKFDKSIEKLRSVAWFGSTVWDKIKMEAENE